MMDDDARLNLEERLHALLCDEPDSDERRALLALVSRDDEARQLLGEMIQTQTQARAACGYDEADDALRASMASILSSVPAAGSLPATERIAGRGVGTSRRRRRAWWVLRAAAAVVVLASVFVAVTAVRTGRRIEEKLAQMEQALSMPQVSAAEVDSYRQIWQHVGEGPARSRPWVLLGEGAGRFGYVPTAGDTRAGAEMLLLRCRMVTATGHILETFNVLVPTGGRTRLSLPDVGRLKGHPIHCEVATAGACATVAVMVGTEPATTAGVKGRVMTGEEPVELGQFRMDGDRVHVVFQAVGLGGSIG